MLEEVSPPEKKRRREHKLPDVSAPQPPATPAPGVKPKHAPGDGDRRGHKSDSEAPAIFSEAWIADLQQWVDHLQKRRR
ncbi:MAG: hypothetical protein U0903_17380 [Planctomycetales bacterium]